MSAQPQRAKQRGRVHRRFAKRSSAEAALPRPQLRERLKDSPSAVSSAISSLWRCEKRLVELSLSKSVNENEYGGCGTPYCLCASIRNFRFCFVLLQYLGFAVT
jgi:hypothetical protein